MNGAAALRHTDVAARVAMVGSGWCALAAMWVASGRTIYPIAAVIFAVVAGLAALPGLLGVASTHVRRALIAAKSACCAALFVSCLGTGAFDAGRLGAHQPGAALSIVPTFGAMLVMTLVAQVATTATRRDVCLGAPIICAMLVQAGMAAHDASPTAAFAGSLVAMVVAVALVYRAELLHEATTVVAHRAGRRSAGAFRIAKAAAIPAASVAGIGALVFVLLPNSLELRTRPAAHVGRAAASDADATPSTTNGRGDVGPHSVAIADPASGGLDLRVRGPLSPAPVFVVSSTSPAYWQGAVYDHYDGTSWTATGGGSTAQWTVSPVADSAVYVQQAPPDPDRPAGAAVQQRTDSVHIVSSQPLHTVFAPGSAITYTGRGRVAVDADGNPRIQMSITTSVSAPSARDYDVVSTRPVVPPTGVAAAAAAGAAGDAAGAAWAARWLQVPPQLPSRIKALADRLAGGTAANTSPAAAVNSIDDYLRRNETYDLGAPVPAAGEDAVDDFLFVSHKGFCEQFASATVVLLRSAGIPARVVAGYSQGDTSSSPGERVMRGSDAHAWVQVWYPGVGWVDDDPTASSVLASTEATAAPEVAPSASGSPAPAPSAVVGDSGVSADLRHAVSRFPAGRLGLIAAALLFALLLRVFVVFIRRRLRARTMPVATERERVGGGPVLQAYWRLDNALSAIGRPRVAGETPREIAVRLHGVVASADRIAMALDLLERECYAVEPLTAAEAAAAVASFEALSHEALSHEARATHASAAVH